MKRKYYFLIIMLLSVIYFTGSQPPEIADRIMVHAIGIDAEEEGYRVTMQTFTPESSGSETSIDPSQPNVSLVSDSGRTVGEAIRICFNRLGGNIFIGQNQILLFGRGVDLSQKEDLFGYFLSSSETFLNVDCAAAENTAEEILRTPITGNAITSDKYPEMIRSASDNGRCVEVSFTELLDRINSHEKTLVLPTFSLSQQTSGDPEGGENSGGEEKSDKLEERRLKISSGAVYADGKFRAEISAEQMGIYGMICDSGENVHAEISGGGRKYSETYRICSRAVTASSEGEEIVFCISARAIPLDSQMFEAISDRSGSETAAKREIEKKAAAFAEAMCAEFTPEIFGADYFLMRHYPQVYRQYADDPEELYRHVRIAVEIE